MNYNEQMQRIWRMYEEAGEEVPATAHQVAEWAFRNGHWKPRPSDVIGQCAEDLARALREEYISDAKGRRVRAKHVARIKKGPDQPDLWQWADIRTATRPFMELALKQRRNAIIGDCRQLKLDTDSYNDEHASEPPIRMLYDFTVDLEEDAA